MKRISLILLAVLTATFAWGQDITGKWNGALKVQGQQLRIVFNISKTESGYASTMDSPDQGAAGIPVTTTTFENSTLTLKIPNAQIIYTAELNDGVFKGTFKQGNFTTAMDLSREAIEKQETKRSQDPVKPYPYRSEEVVFTNNSANVRLAGTLTLPAGEGQYPVAVLISGSGPQNRDEELLGHKPFLILSDYLTRNGIAVLRYDDRGTASSTGVFRDATTEDLATDAEAAIAWLKTRKEIDPKHIGLIGHSEGGIIAPLVASRSKDVSFIVMLAGTGMTGLELLPLQSALISKASGTSEADLKKTNKINSKIFKMVAKSDDEATLKKDLEKYLLGVVGDFPASDKPSGVSDEDFVKMLVNQVANPWMMFFLRYDPIPALKKVECPVLALNGEKDLQVPPAENLPPIRRALKKNKNATVVEIPGLNHLFQECTTGSPAEYGQIDVTMSPKVLKAVTEWVLTSTTRRQHP
jgi:pimeloyl-ACP methyl ester carboxylesterase